MFKGDKKQKKQTSGITLVALVVTIVVLLILAGITITMLFSDSGIINKAREAAEATKNAQSDTEQGLENLAGDMGVALGKPTTIKAAEKVAELKLGDYVNYIDSKGNKTKCVVLYDKEYNEKNSTNFGIQAVTVDNVKEDISFDINNSDYSDYSECFKYIFELINSENTKYTNENLSSLVRVVGSHPATGEPSYQRRDSNLGVKDPSTNYALDYNAIKDLPTGSLTYRFFLVLLWI